MITLTSIIYSLKAVVAGSIFFVWVVRYQNIVEEFKVAFQRGFNRDFSGSFRNCGPDVGCHGNPFEGTQPLL